MATPDEPGIYQVGGHTDPMPLTIRPEDDARPVCPKCGARMRPQSVTGDQREASTGPQAWLCPQCGTRVE